MPGAGGTVRVRVSCDGQPASRLYQNVHLTGFPYLTEKEWKQVVGPGLEKISFGQLKGAFGMILNDAAPEQAQITRDTIPRPPG